MSFNLRNRSFLTLSDFSTREMEYMLNLAEDLKKAKYAGYEGNRLAGKNIALIFEKDDDLLIDLKLTPEHGDEVREYDGVFPGYHMNKTHWKTVRVNNTSLPFEGLVKMIEESDKLTK